MLVPVMAPFWYIRKGGEAVVAKKDLIPVRSKEEAKARGRNGGLKSGEARRQKKNMREMAKSLMEASVSKQMGNVRDTLKRMGIDENDMTYQAAVVVRMIQ